MAARFWGQRSGRRHPQTCSPLGSTPKVQLTCRAAPPSCRRRRRHRMRPCQPAPHGKHRAQRRQPETDQGRIDRHDASVIHTDPPTHQWSCRNLVQRKAEPKPEYERRRNLQGWLSGRRGSGRRAARWGRRAAGSAAPLARQAEAWPQMQPSVRPIQGDQRKKPGLPSSARQRWHAPRPRAW